MKKFQHPPGLRSLFLTEMWERFSYYGMRALLVLYMVAGIDSGGLGLDPVMATAIYGLYTGAVYLAALPGGWIADRFLGARRAVWIGGWTLTAGHAALAFSGIPGFFTGLTLVVIGTGLLKPNVSTLVGGLYAPDDNRRESGFTLFYMGINLGAFLGPLVCGVLGEKIRWHWGFAAAGVGMLPALMVFHRARGLMGDEALRPGQPGPLKNWERTGLWVGGVVALVGLGIFVLAPGMLNPVRLAEGVSGAVVLVAIVWFGGIFLGGPLEPVERKNVLTILVLFVASALFWAGFEQAGSSFNLFAEQHTNREVSFIQGTIPATWFQSLGPIFIVLTAPAFAWLWVWLGRRQLDPSTPAKFGFGLLLLGIGFAVMAGAATYVVSGQKVLPTWLILTYLLHTFGELCLSPVGLSAVTRLAPRRLVGQMMGLWFLATSLGNLLAGLMAGRLLSGDVEGMPRGFLVMFLLACGAGGMLILVAWFVGRKSSGRKA